MYSVNCMSDHQLIMPSLSLALALINREQLFAKLEGLLEMRVTKTNFYLIFYFFVKKTTSLKNTKKISSFSMLCEGFCVILKDEVNNQLGQSGRQGAPEFWCPHIFFGLFLMVFSHLCWQCSDKTRKCQEHINTLIKKEKLIFLKPILEIKTKNLF